MALRRSIISNGIVIGAVLAISTLLSAGAQPPPGYKEPPPPYSRLRASRTTIGAFN